MKFVLAIKYELKDQNIYYIKKIENIYGKVLKIFIFKY